MRRALHRSCPAGGRAAPGNRRPHGSSPARPANRWPRKVRRAAVRWRSPPPRRPRTGCGTPQTPAMRRPVRSRPRRPDPTRRRSRTAGTRETDTSSPSPAATEIANSPVTLVPRNSGTTSDCTVRWSCRSIPTGYRSITISPAQSGRAASRPTPICRPRSGPAPTVVISAGQVSNHQPRTSPRPPRPSSHPSATSVKRRGIRAVRSGMYGNIPSGRPLVRTGLARVHSEFLVGHQCHTQLLKVIPCVVRGPLRGRPGEAFRSVAVRTSRPLD